MKRALSIITSICLLFNFGISQNSAGWTMRTISGRQTTEFSGVRLQLLTGDTLRYRWRNLEAWTMADSVVSISQTKGEGKIVRSVLLGGVGLGAGGYLVGTVLEGNKTPTNYYGYYGPSEKDDIDWKIVLPIVGVAVGAGLGALFAPSLERTEYQFTTYTKEEKLRVLQSLIDDKVEPAGARSATNVNKDDVVYLKNGSIIRGNVIEMVPDSLLKLRTMDGSLFVFKMSEVAKLTRPDSPGEVAARGTGVTAPVTASAQRNSLPQPQIAFDSEFDTRPRLTLRGGLSVPTGEFADEISTGFAMTGELMFPRDENSAFGFNLTAAFNTVDVSSVPSGVNADVGMFTSVWPMLAFNAQTTSSSSVQLSLQPRIGLVIATNPEATLSQGAIRVTQQSSTGTAAAFGGCAGLLISKKIKIEGTFMTGKPEFEIRATGPAGSVTGKGKASVSLFILSFGYTF